MFTFWNSYVLKLLRLETISFSDATLSDMNVVWCYVLSQYQLVERPALGSNPDISQKSYMGDISKKGGIYTTKPAKNIKNKT